MRHQMSNQRTSCDQVFKRQESTFVSCHFYDRQAHSSHIFPRQKIIFKSSFAVLHNFKVCQCIVSYISNLKPKNCSGTIKILNLKTAVVLIVSIFLIQEGLFANVYSETYGILLVSYGISCLILIIPTRRHT